MLILINCTCFTCWFRKGFHFIKQEKAIIPEGKLEKIEMGKEYFAYSLPSLLFYLYLKGLETFTVIENYPVHSREWATNKYLIYVCEKEWPKKEIWEEREVRVSKGDDRAGKYLRTKLKGNGYELACVHFSTDQK